MVAPCAWADGGAGGGGVNAGGTGFTGNPGGSNGDDGGGGGGAGGGNGGNGPTGVNGGAGGTSGSPNGQPGESFATAGGGGGGWNGNGSGETALSGASLTGGNGGAGGTGASSGGGGAGGYGAIVTGTSQTMTVTGTITGGNGGAGSIGAQAGSGGDGGTGVHFTSTGNTLTNNGSIFGGNGGAGGQGAGPFSGTNGSGGVGIFAAANDLTIINNGTITAGVSGGGTRANAITFNGGTNTLSLGASSAITGVVQAASAGDTLRLGSLNDSGSFNAGTIGGSVQYRGFGVFEKTGVGNWTLTGTATTATPWSVTEGTLSGTTSSFLGNLSVGSGSVIRFDQSTNGAYAGDISGNGRLIKAGSGTVTLIGTASHASGTTISGGTLAIGDGGSIAGTITNNTNFAFNRTTALNFTNRITGSGSVTQSGTGVTTLTNTANDYSGGTSITGGTLSISSNAQLGNTSGGLSLAGGTLQTTTTLVTARTVTLGTGGGTFETASGSLTIGGAIGGTGGLIKTGSGTLNLAVDNGYQGGTTINGGAISVATDARLGAASGGLTFDGGILYTEASFATARTMTINSSGATLAPVNFNTHTVSGNIGGTGRLTVDGFGGTLVLSGSNNYSGGTTVTTGTLQGTTTSLQGDITNDGTLVFNQSTDGTYAGSIGGGGGVTKSGSGAVILSGTSTVGGGTTVSAGRLAVNGSLTSDVTVDSGANIGGSGTITGTLTNNGILAPGNSIGTLNVTGNYNQASGSTYQVEVNPAGQSDRIVVSGTATISSGANVQVVASAGSYARNTTYTILTAGTRTGTYGGVTSNFAFLTPALSYDATSVFLTLTSSASAFAAGAQTPNQRVVGTVLDAALASASGDFNTVLSALFGLDTVQGPKALETLSGQNYSGFASFNLQSALAFMNNLLNQVGGGTASAPGGTAHVAIAEACDVACDGASGARWGAWGSGIGAFGSLAGDSNSGSVTYNLGGFSTGLDYRFSSEFLAGVTAGYTSGRNWTNGFTGSAFTDSVFGGLYAKFTPGNFYVDALAGYGYADNRMTRVISIPGLATRQAQARTGTNIWFGQLEGGYRIGLSDTTSVTPFARLQGTTATQAGFSEWGADSLNLTVAQQTSNSLRSTFGAQANAAWEKFSASFRLGWVHEYGDVSRPVTAALAGASAAPFTTYGAAAARDGAVVGLQLGYDVADGIRATVRYDGEIIGQNSSHTINAGLRISF